LKTLLFLCTGNYYRSRYAEIRFNHLARANGLTWRAVSRGLAPDPRNPGPLSVHTIAALTRLRLGFDDNLREPLLVTDDDFAAADRVVAVKEAEHRGMIERDFPSRLTQVEFWHVHDLDCSGPDEALAELDQLVIALVDELYGEDVGRSA